MEISGKVLREVEFRDRLRGYDTDEVDEFLENVAIAVDELHEQVAALRQRAASAPPAPAPVPAAAAELPVFDDDSIKRTLILAQRTADLAIREANDEAAKLLEEAQHEAAELVSKAAERARLLREESEVAYEQQVAHQILERDRLQREVQSLADVVGNERNRLTESLQSVLQYVSEHLTMTPLGTTQDQGAPPEPAEASSEQPAARPLLFDDDEADLGLPDVESEISEDAEIAFVGPIGDTGPVPTTHDLDPDEELWKRWAQSSDLDAEDDPDTKNDLFGFDQPVKDD